jgi:hypothetical protein
VKTAQQISGITPNIDQVRDPGSFSRHAQRRGTRLALLSGSLDSGFVYYGCHDDECSARRRRAIQRRAQRGLHLAANPPPTPRRRRFSFRSGIRGIRAARTYGVQYGYKVTVEQNSDFWIWTYAYDVSGITNVSLLLRVNGTNPPTSDQFKTYAGGSLTGAWQTSNMTQRVTPVIGVTPQYIADYYYTKVSGISNAFVDYYVSATDARGNTYKSPIQHVWVGAGSGGFRRRRQRRANVGLPRYAGCRKFRDDSIRRRRTRHCLGQSGLYSSRLEQLESGRLARRRDDIQLRVELVAMHRDRPDHRDESELLLQQRLRQLGQQRRRELEFHRGREQQPPATVAAAKSDRGTRADQPDQFELVRRRRRGRLFREPRQFNHCGNGFDELLRHRSGGEFFALLFHRRFQQRWRFAGERDGLHEHARRDRQHSALRAGRRV